MRRSPLSIAIGISFFPGVQLAASRVGPISPYQSVLNREIYYRMLGKEVIRARSAGKTVAYPFRYNTSLPMAQGMNHAR